MRVVDRVAPRSKCRQITLVDFQERFGTDDACREYLEGIRWQAGFCCPRCEGSKGYACHSRHIIECALCGYQASATAGTVFHRSKVPLRKWFLGIFLTAQSKRGISSLELSKQIGVHQETAWSMQHKIRRAMEARDRLYTLGGIVDMDDATFGGVKHGKVGRGTTRVKAVVATSTDENQVLRYAKITTVSSWSQSDLNDVAKTVVAPGSTIYTDGLSGFAGLSEIGYKHEVIETTRLVEEGASPFPDVHMLISNAKAWILGTFHGLGPKYMGVYLAEFIYRFNRRRLEHRLFDRLIAACMWAPHTPLATIVAG